MGCKMPWWAGSENPPPDKDKIIADLRAEVARLTQQRAAANSRVEKYQTALEHIAQWSQELQDDAIARGFVLAQWRGCVAYAVVALSDLPEAAQPIRDETQDFSDF